MIINSYKDVDLNSQFITITTWFTIFGTFFISCIFGEKHTASNFPPHHCRCFSNLCGCFKLTNNWTPRTISMVKFIFPITNQMASCIHMFELNYCCTSNFFTKWFKIISLRVKTLYCPVVTIITFAVISVARDLIFVREWRWDWM